MGLGSNRRGASVLATGAVALCLLLAVAGPASASPAPGSLVAVTTTLVPTTTTTTPVAPTTTTEPASTTTLAPTTTTLAPTTTTSSSTTMTTTAPLIAPAPSTSSTPWGLIVLIIVLVIGIVLIIVLLAARKRRGLEADWRRAVIPALSDAQLAREALLSGNAVSDSAEVRGAVSVQVERAGVALDRAARGAPDPEAATTASSAAGSLRGLAFAIEADRLLRHGSASPTGEQLAQADEARRARTGELNTALARLSTRIGSSPHR
jgi:hypothetical protein